MVTAQLNPLLEAGSQIPFDRITPEHIEPAVETMMQTTREALDAIVAVEGPRTYDNTLGAFDRATERLELVITIVGHLEAVTSSGALREVYNRVKPEVSAFFARIPLDDGLYQAMLTFAKTEDAKALSGAKRRFLDKTLDDFKRHGAELDADGKARLEAISRELAELTARYAQNVLDATAAFERIVTDEAHLAGLPDGARAAARQDAERRGKEGWRFTLHAPSLIPALTYLDDAALREELYRAYHTRASQGERANPPLIGRILELRKEKAKLLGFETFADLVLQDRMAKNAATAVSFIEDLEKRTRSAFDGENTALESFRRATEGDDAPAIAPWDLAYYAEKQRKARFDFDEEALRPYFSADAVVKGLFETARRLYGVEVRPTSELATWHPDVTAYHLLDEDGARIGSFYVDLFPRDEKRGGAWMHGIFSGVLEGGRVEPHLGLICGNLTPPLGDKPALLLHSEVETLFHEFGHLLHHLLSRVEVRSLSGTNVAWDFVELPSQIMENWCWEREALDLFARHYETQQPIPEALFERMTRARTYRAAYAQMRQLGFATVDLDLHVRYEPERDGDVVGHARSIMQRFSPVAYPEDYAFVCSFSHLFSSAVGYAAGYYSYKWAEVLDADAFTRFAKDGIFSREVGRAFRTQILSRGDGEDPARLYEAFMGRPPRLDALLRRSGLLEDAA